MGRWGARRWWWVSAGSLSVACANSGASPPAAPVARTEALGEPCALAAPPDAAAKDQRVLLEVAIATFDSSGSTPVLPPPVQHRSTDPRVELAWSARTLVVPGGAARLSWGAAPPKLVAGQLAAKVLDAATPERIRIELAILGGASPAHTTLVVRAQQTIFLALPGTPGAIVAATPYLATGTSQLAQLQTCKPGPWSDATTTVANQPQGAPTEPVTPSSSPVARVYPQFQLGGTLVRDLPSALTQKTHQLLISLPQSFKAEPTRRYPVLFLLDAQWDFPLVNAIAGNIHYDRVFPEMLIVGLSYAGERPDYGALRAEDYIPTAAPGREGKVMGGGAAKFLQFLEADVIPLVEREYRADPERRVLAGASFGGTFALYSLFERPDLFWGYIAASPNVVWNEREVFARERAFRAAHPALERRVWLSSASLERPDYAAAIRDFGKQLKGSRYRGLALDVRSIEGERHAGLKAEAFTRALRFIAEPLVPPPAP